MTKKVKTGAQTLIESLEKLEVRYIFGYPGGAAMPIFDALYDSSIELILVRHEQGATHMADGYARACQKPGVVLVTSGPGATTNTVTGLLTAQMDSIPMIVIGGQQITPMLGKDAFQEADVFSITAPTVKHSYLVKDSNHIPQIAKESFHIATTGRPGTVVIDIPKDIASSHCETDFESATMELPGYNPSINSDFSNIEKMATLINQSKQPLLLVGHGAIISNAHKEVQQLAETLKAPVVTTKLGKGIIPETHPLSLGMLGMHGTAVANRAVQYCDCIFSIGSRWDDRITPADISKFCPDAAKLHIDIDPAEINKIVMPDCSIVADAKELKKLTPKVKQLSTTKWLKYLNQERKKHPLSYKIHGGLKAQHIIDELWKQTNGNAIVTTDVGQHQMWAAQFYKNNQPNSWISSGRCRHHGFGVPSAIGAQFAQPNKTVLSINGDGGFQMMMCELSTASIHKLPIKFVIIDNKYLGMVRQWQELFFDDRLSGVDLEGSPDFIKLGNAYGIKGIRIKRPADVTKKIKEALEYNDGPIIIHAEVAKQDNVFPMVPAGGAASDMLIERPKQKMEKPKGST